MLNFLGRGSAFSHEHNSAFFIDNNDLILIDCPATSFQRLKTMHIESFNNIYILVTHTHGDHSGGIGLLSQYTYFALQKKVTVVAPSKDVYNDLYTLLICIEGCKKEWLNLITANQLHKNWFITAIPTTHVEQLNNKCFGYVFRVNNTTIVYTGDTNTLKPYLTYLHNGSFFYTEASIYKSDVHLYLPDILQKLIELTNYDVHVYLMHLDNEQKIKEIIHNTKIQLAPLV